MLCSLRRWLRALEPKARSHLDRSWLASMRPWLERRELFRFQRQPLARGVAAGMFCGLIPGPLQIPGTLLVCAIYWGYAGTFLDFWDAFLWLLAFALIELNVLEWQAETK